MYHLFERFGIELEYMIVDKETLSVNPLTDKVLEKVHGAITNEVTCGDIGWSNELALHVIELKTAQPAESLDGLDRKFHENIRRINEILSEYNACLMGGPMHPFMDPYKEIRLWPHDYSPIYNAFDKIFSCKGHGWANLQSMHINLPFANDDEFGRLHAAIRLVLPLIPGLSAGSPFADAKATGFHDTRMETYRKNSIKIPSITGSVIPEAVFTQKEYEEKILQKIYHDLDWFDPQKILQEEWVNARGAIARFERNTIEIRVIDVQETPFSDLAIADLVIKTVQMLISEKYSSLSDQKRILQEPLVSTFLDSIHLGEKASVTDSEYLRVLGAPGEPCTLNDLWKNIDFRINGIEKKKKSENYNPLDILFEKGTLATRILEITGHSPSKSELQKLCSRLCGSLNNGVMIG